MAPGGQVPSSVLSGGRSEVAAKLAESDTAMGERQRDRRSGA